MAKGTFGEHLRREREMRGVSLDEISSATRISTRFLEALENEQWERLPGGVFNRGFVRAVAHYLGLNEEDLVAQYAQTTNDQPLVAVWADQVEKKKPAVRSGVLWMFLLALLAGGAWYAWEDIAPLVAAWFEPAAPPPAPRQPAAPAAAVLAAEPLELKVDAGQSTSLRITADGAVIFDGRLASGESRRFQARERLEVSVGNSSAVLLELNGQTLPPLALPGAAGTVTLTHKDLPRFREAQPR